MASRGHLAMSERRLLSKLSTETLLSLVHCHKHSNQAFPLLLFPSSGTQQRKPVKLVVDEDKNTKGSNYPPSEVAVGLSPYTFPQKWPFHVSEEENIAWEGMCLAGLLYSNLLSGYRNKGSSVRLKIHQLHQ